MSHPQDKLRSLDGVHATTLITLQAKARESLESDSILRDTEAAIAIGRIPFSLKNFQVSRDGMISIALRAFQFDQWTRQFLGRHPDGVIVQLGCGLDTRYYRIQCASETAWYGIDFPEVLQFRNRILPTQGEIEFIESSLLETDWFSRLPQNRPILFIAEGVFPYLARRELLRFLQTLSSNFPQGHIAFDCYDPLVIRLLNLHSSMRLTHARLATGIRSSTEITSEIPRLVLREEFFDYDPRQIAKMSWPIRAAWNIPRFRRLVKLFLFEITRDPQLSDHEPGL